MKINKLQQAAVDLTMALHNSTKSEIAEAVASASYYAHHTALPPTRKKIWLDIGRLLRREYRRKP